MSANNNFYKFIENHDEGLMLDAMSFIFGSNSWARMMAAGACTWADRSPLQGSVALQWWYPFNIAMPCVSVTSLSGYRSFNPFSAAYRMFHNESSYKLCFMR